MSGWLLDTNVVSALAPKRPPIPAELADWLEVHSSSLFLSAITAAEIEAGIAKLRRSGGETRAQALAAWFDTLVGDYADRILPVDLPVARIAGALADTAIARGSPTGFADVLIAATARAHGLTVLTQNLRHFEPLDVTVRDPFSREAS